MPPDRRSDGIRFDRRPDGTIVLTQHENVITIGPETLRSSASTLMGYDNDSVDHTDYIVQQEASAKSEARAIRTEASLNVTFGGVERREP